MTKSFLICVLVVLSTPSVSHSEQPIDVLQKSINTGITILKDPQYQDTTEKDRQQEILCETAWEAFDFKEFSQRVLGSNWRNFSSSQRRQFINVFSEFLCKYYITRLQERYTDEEVNYLSQHPLAKSQALVKVNVLWKGVEVPVEVRMLKRNDTWKVYDIIVLGVSGVRNYRAQFQAILLKQSPTQVIGLIESRIKQEQKRAHNKRKANE
ncbi:MAG: MlaC/ttg2D family ABC transporter substrate-binding protein [Syntrophobacteria bacterium]|jgi:phospholipid transport system substrate-binding protein